MKHDGTLSIDWFEGWEDDFIKQLIVGDTSTIPEFGDESKSAVVVVASQTEKTENQLAEESLYEGMQFYYSINCIFNFKQTSLCR